MAKGTGQTAPATGKILDEVRAVIRVLVSDCGCSPHKAIRLLTPITNTIFDSRRKGDLYDIDLQDRALMVQSGAAGQFLRPGEALTLAEILDLELTEAQVLGKDEAPGTGCCGG